MFFTEFAILVEFQTFRRMFLVFVRLVVALLAFGASQCYRVAHCDTSLTSTDCDGSRRVIIIGYYRRYMLIYFTTFHISCQTDMTPFQAAVTALTKVININKTTGFPAGV